jgi:hypothetical protein
VLAAGQGRVRDDVLAFAAKIGIAVAPAPLSAANRRTSPSMDRLGRSYLLMAVPAFVMIAIDQSLVPGHAASGRIALLGAIGATVGLGIYKLFPGAADST